MSLLDDLMDEVRVAAKNEALAEYENTIDHLRRNVEQLHLELDRMTVSNDRWKKAFEDVTVDFQSTITNIRMVIDGR